MGRKIAAIIAGVAFGIAAFLGLFAVCAGVAWLYLFGDDPWPEWSWVVLVLPPLLGAGVAGYGLFHTIMTWPKR